MSDEEIIALLRAADRQRERMQARLAAWCATQEALEEARETVLVAWVARRLRMRNN